VGGGKGKLTLDLYHSREAIRVAAFLAILFPSKVRPSDSKLAVVFKTWKIMKSPIVCRNNFTNDCSNLN
jgi:hypothetical protein